MMGGKVKPLKGRIEYLDIARGLAILFMFTQHCMLIHEKNAGSGNDPLAMFFVLLGTAPAAPVFMMIMGVFLMLSKASLRTNVIRGLKLVMLGYVLNLIRFTIPLLIAGMDGMMYSEGETPLDMLLTVDILQLAGLSFIIGSLLKKPLKRTLTGPALILVVAIISPFLWGWMDQMYPLAVLWGEGSNIFFPLFPWIIFPILGMTLSKVLIDHDLFSERIIRYGIAGSVLLLAGILTYDIFPEGDYHRSGLSIQLLIIGFILLWMVGLFILSRRYGRETRIKSLLIFWSKNVTAVYFIQWVLFGWSMLFFGANEMPSYNAALIGLLILLITHLLVKFKWVRYPFKFI